MADEKLDLPMDISEKHEYVTYLIGSMEKTAEKDDGGIRREEIEKELIKRGVFPINPVKLEASKTGMTTDELKEKMKGWIAGGTWELFTEKAREIWKGSDGVLEGGAIVHVMGDIDYVIASDFITFSLRKGDQPCGSYAECGVALEHNIPIYLMTDYAKRDLPKSLLQMVLASNGEVFENLNQYLEFIDKEFGFKVKEVK